MQGGAPNVPPQMNKKSGNTSVLPLLYLFTVTSYVGMIQIRYTGPDGISQISARFRRLPGTYFLFTLLFYYTTSKGGCQVFFLYRHVNICMKAFCFPDTGASSKG